METSTSKDIQQIPIIKLSDYFKLFQPYYVLGTTYTLSLAFFESVVWPHIKKNKLHKCLILCDQLGFRRAISEAGALRSVTNDYMVAAAPTKYNFHPKVWLMIGEDQASLLVGSGNLTQSGFIDNIELFDVLNFSKNDGNKVLCNDVLSFINGIQSMWLETSDKSMLILQTLKEMKSMMKEVHNIIPNRSESGVRLISSYNGSIFDQLLPFATDCDEICIASPYFGNSVEGIKHIQKTITPSKTRVFPAVHSGKLIDVPIKKLKAIPNTSIETLRIVENSNKFAHFKLYGFLNKSGKGWLFNGSVNCTKNALEGKNIEAGIFRQVPRNIVQQYFRKGEKTLGSDLGKLKQTWPKGKWLTCWGVSIGEFIKLSFSPSSIKHAPFSQVSISVRGGYLKSEQKFESIPIKRDSVKIAWSNFPELKPSSRASWLLEFFGLDKDGTKCAGGCFVDNFVSISAGPQQRSAWRAVLSVLGEEGLPENFEISAVYNLLNEVMDPSAILKDKKQKEDIGKGSTQDNLLTDKEKNLIPIWPPKPFEKNPWAKSSSFHSKNILFFQNILSALLSQETEIEGKAIEDSHEENEDETKLDDKKLEKKLKRAAKAGRKVIKSSFEDFERLERRLKSLIISPEVSYKILPVSITGLIFTLELRRATAKSTMGQIDVPSLLEFLFRFIEMLFGTRKQLENFCVTSDCRYKHTTFPPIVYDLNYNFSYNIDKDLATILLSIFCYIKAFENVMKYKIFPLNQWLLFRDSIEKDIDNILFGESEVIKAFCKRFTIEGNDHIVEDKIDNILSLLKNNYWEQHPGYVDLKILKMAVKDQSKKNIDSCSHHLQKNFNLLHRGYKKKRIFQRVDCLSSYCTIEGCTMLGLVNPDLQILTKQKPVICRGCGSVLIPEQLHDAYMKRN
jgi:HKD family nuclease